MTGKWHLQISLAFHSLWALLLMLSFELPLYRIEVTVRQECDILVNSITFPIKRAGSSDLLVSSTFHDFRAGQCSEATSLCSDFCDFSGRFAAAGVIYTGISIATIAMVFLAILHLGYLIVVKAIAFGKANYLHLAASIAAILAGALHFILSGGMALNAEAGSGSSCILVEMLFAALAGGHFMYLNRRGLLGPPQLKYTEVEGTHMSMDSGRPNSGEEIQIETTEPHEDKKNSKSSFDDTQRRFQALDDMRKLLETDNHSLTAQLSAKEKQLREFDDMRKSLMSDNQSLATQLGEKDKLVHELEQKVIRSQNNVQVTAALNLAKQKEEEVNKLLSRLRDSDENGLRLGKAVEEIRDKLKEKEIAEGKFREREVAESRLREEKDAKIRNLTQKVAEIETRSKAEAEKLNAESRESCEARYREILAKEKGVWQIEKKQLEDSINSLQINCESLKRALEACREEMKDRENSLHISAQSSDQKISELNQDKDKLVKSNQELTDEIRALRSVLQTKEMEFSSLLESTKGTESALVSELKRQVEAGNAETHKWRDAGKTAAAELAEARKEIEIAKAATQKSAEQAESTLVAMADELKELKGKCDVDQKEKEAALMCLERVRQKFDDLYKEREEALAALHDTLLKEKDELEIRLARTEEERRNEKQVVLAANESVNREKDALQVEMRKLQEQLSLLQEERNSLAATSSDLDAEKGVVLNELTKLQEDHQSSQKERERLREANGGLQEKCDQFQVLVSRLEAEGAALRDEKDSALKANESARKEKEILQQKLFSLLSEHEAITQNISDLTALKEKAESELKSAKSSFESEQKKLLAEVEQSKNLLLGKEAELAKAAAKISEVTQQKNETTGKFLALLSESEEVKQELEELKQRR